jgi:hypothetical protein
MKAITLYFLILFSSYVMKAQNFIENVPFDSTLMKGVINSLNCTGGATAQIQLDNSLYNYVDGMQFVIIIDSLGPNAGGSIHKGDTIKLSAASPSFQLSNAFTGDYWYRIKLIGTPHTPNQQYPCKFYLAICTCNCKAIMIQKASSTMCRVAVFNGQKEVEEINSVNIYPNPTMDKFTVSGIREKSYVRLYDTIGKLILEKETNTDVEIDTCKLAEGVYSLSISNTTSGTTSQKVVVNR